MATRNVISFAFFPRCSPTLSRASRLVKKTLVRSLLLSLVIGKSKNTSLHQHTKINAFLAAFSHLVYGMYLFLVLLLVDLQKWNISTQFSRLCRFSFNIKFLTHSIPIHHFSNGIIARWSPDGEHCCFFDIGVGSGEVTQDRSKNTHVVEKLADLPTGIEFFEGIYPVLKLILWWWSFLGQIRSTQIKSAFPQTRTVDIRHHGSNCQRQGCLGCPRQR